MLSKWSILTGHTVWIIFHNIVVAGTWSCTCIVKCLCHFLLWGMHYISITIAAETITAAISPYYMIRHSCLWWRTISTFKKMTGIIPGPYEILIYNMTISEESHQIDGDGQMDEQTQRWISPILRSFKIGHFENHGSWNWVLINQRPVCGTLKESGIRELCNLISPLPPPPPFVTKINLHRNLFMVLWNEAD